jgi:hypothetical protein
VLNYHYIWSEAMAHGDYARSLVLMKHSGHQTMLPDGGDEVGGCWSDVEDDDGCCSEQEMMVSSAKANIKNQGTESSTTLVTPQLRIRLTNFCI